MSQSCRTAHASTSFHLLFIIELVSYVSSSFFPPQEGAPVNYEREGMTDVSVPLAIFQQNTLWIHVSSKSDYDVCLLLNFDSCWLTIDLWFDLNLITSMSCHSFQSYFVATWATYCKSFNHCNVIPVVLGEKIGIIRSTLSIGVMRSFLRRGAIFSWKTTSHFK